MNSTLNIVLLTIGTLSILESLVLMFFTKEVKNFFKKSKEQKIKIVALIELVFGLFLVVVFFLFEKGLVG